MDSDDPKFHALPKGQESTLLLVSTAFLGVVFAVIGGFVFKLWYDERQARQTRERYAEMEGMDEIMGTGGGRRNRRNRGAETSSEGNFSEFQPGHVDDDDEERSDQGSGTLTLFHIYKLTCFIYRKSIFNV
jgi:hypothetical protein